MSKIDLTNKKLLLIDPNKINTIKTKINNYTFQMKDLPAGFLILDTEYFQFPDKGEIKKIVVELSFMVVHNYNLIEAHTTWFKLNDEHYEYWRKNHPKQFDKLHWYVDNCGTNLLNFWNHYDDFFTESLIIAHGHNTEESELNQFFKRFKMSHPDIIWLDSLQLYDNLDRRIKRHPENLRLKTLTEEFGLVHTPHFASSDTKAILDLLMLWHDELHYVKNRPIKQSHRQRMKNYKLRKH